MRHLTLAAAALVAPLVLVAAAPTSTAPRTPATATAPTAAWKVDNGHSAVLFKTKHLGVAYAYGRFDQVAGTVQFDPANPGAASVSIEVDAASVNSNDEGRDKHLRGADFFSVKEFPKITFESKSVAKRADGHLDVQGELTFHGVTKTIDLVIEVVGTGKDPWGGTRGGFHTSFTIDPREYEIAYMQEKDMLGPEVELTVSLEVVQG